jgi:hypothetical protein
MKSPSLDNIYAKLDKHILLAQSYTEIGELFFIIKACRLKPSVYVFEDKNEKLILHRNWFDEYGNSFTIINKTIKIVYNDLLLDRDKITCTDLYAGLSLNKILKVSKMAYLCAGKDEDLSQECCLLTLLGIDNYLRTYLYMYGSWRQVSPLVIGLENLQIIGKHKDIEYFRQFSKKENMPIPCHTAEQWLTCLPPSSGLVSLVGQRYETIASLFDNETKE